MRLSYEDSMSVNERDEVEDLKIFGVNVDVLKRCKLPFINFCCLSRSRFSMLRSSKSPDTQLSIWNISVLYLRCRYKRSNANRVRVMVGGPPDESSDPVKSICGCNTEILSLLNEKAVIGSLSWPGSKF